MNRKSKLIGVAVIIGILCTACSLTPKEDRTQSGTSQSKPSESAGSVPAIASSEKSTTDTDTTATVPTDAKPFYGTWKVSACIGKSTAYALSQDEIDHLVGTTVTYESKSYRSGTAEIDISGYHEESQTAEQFHNDFGIQLTDIGVSETDIKSVTVGAEGDFFGATVYIKSADTLVIYYEGVFFEAARIQ